MLSTPSVYTKANEKKENKVKKHLWEKVLIKLFATNKRKTFQYARSLSHSLSEKNYDPAPSIISRK